MPGYQSKKLATQRYADDVTLDHILHLRRLANENEDLKAEIERLREALKKIGNGDTCMGLMTHPPICKRAYDARAALKESE